jgi:hypothetical protein
MKILEWDIAAKYAHDWGNFKVSAAYGFTENTDEGCVAAGHCTFSAEAGGGGAPFQGFKKAVETNQVGASLMHVPSGLFVYGMYQNEHNSGTKFLTFDSSGDLVNSAANDTNMWFMKAGIKRTWTPLGATVIWGEGGQYLDEFGTSSCFNSGFLCSTNFTGSVDPTTGDAIPGFAALQHTTVNRWGAGVVQEIDSAAMHVFFRWQHLDLNSSELCTDAGGCLVNNNKFVSQGGRFSPSVNGLDLFQVGGVIFF